MSSEQHQKEPLKRIELSAEEFDAGSKELFDEIDKENKNNYEKCSAVEAFDNFFRCYSLGQQAINYYRYGAKKDCSTKWEDFKFCLSTKTKSAEKADAMIKERKAIKEAIRRSKPNSEDVWEGRG
ncbi:hypothetical protein BDF20DRAFT_862793 [Mycotypha africana]|uniref:uncharacterized protein n=1 Tax=Mycotypha africana TaxID=64632 RepID=UPI002300CEE6|nr:uncharacterized protein BDF20DRAFT_862793 [Mycotypha africana]KAI8981711.1 hypothetical protein BDF20DRAFT_862793 [Mycotypha africana]